MIVVVGQPLYRESEGHRAVDGLPARIALAAAACGRSVQFVGKAGEDDAGDAVVLALAQGGVGHVALLREAGLPTSRVRSVADDTIEDAMQSPAAALEAEDGLPTSEYPLGGSTAGASVDAADVDLALRYLTEFAVLILADSVAPDVVRVVATAAVWADSRLIVVMPAGAVVPEALPPDAIAFEAPEADPEGVFAAMVGSFAAALDDGTAVAEAFRSSVDLGGWTLTPGE